MSSSLSKLTEFVLEAGKKSFNSLNRLTILHILNNMPSSNVSIKYNLKVIFKILYSL
jgi:hypothetical protein